MASEKSQRANGKYNGIFSILSCGRLRHHHRLLFLILLLRRSLFVSFTVFGDKVRSRLRSRLVSVKSSLRAPLYYVCVSLACRLVQYLCCAARRDVFNVAYSFELQLLSLSLLLLANFKLLVCFSFCYCSSSFAQLLCALGETAAAAATD